MLNLKNMTIRRKLMAIIMIPSFIMIVLVIIAFIAWGQIDSRRFILYDTISHLGMIADNCKASLAFNNREDAQQILSTLRFQESITFACVYDKQGKVFAHYKSGDITDNIQAPKPQKDGHTFKNGYFSAFKQVVLDNEVIGTIYMQDNMKRAHSELKWNIIVALIILPIALVAGHLLSSKLQIKISRPILCLTQIAKDISEKKDYSVRALQESDDEIGYLTKVFNTMLEQIQRRDSALIGAKNQLEARVKERTSELTSANEEMSREVTERIKAEEQIRHQNDFLNNIIESLTHPFYVINVDDYTIRIANSAAKQNLEDNACCKLSCHRLTHMRDKPCGSMTDLCPIEEIKKTGKPMVVEHVHYDKDRNQKYVEVHAYPILDEEGKLSEVIEYSLDITERRQALDALKESENKIRSIVENSSDQIFMVDRDYKFLSINKAAADLPTKSPQEMVGKSIFELFPENVAEQFSKNIKKVFDAGENMSIEEQIVIKGREYHVGASLNPIKDNEGIVKAVTGIVRDITEHKRTEQYLRESEKKYRTLIENLPQKVFLKDRNSNYISCNKKYADDVGIDPDEIKGKTDYEFFPRQLAEKYRRDDKQVMETGVTETIEEKYICSGQEMTIQTVKTPVEDEQGNTVGVLGIFWDITDFKRAQEELRQTNQKLLEASRKAGMAEVATDVLHNVGNVLNSINISASFIKEKVLSSKAENLNKVIDMLTEHRDDLGTFLTEDQRGKHIPLYLSEATKLISHERADIAEKLCSLTKNVEHIKQIIKAQQGYARAGGVEVLIDIKEIIEDAVDINSASLLRHKISLKLDVDELPKILLDRQRILQILVNLISNAKHALSRNEQKEKLLVIRCHKHGEKKLRIEVQDNGVGINEDNIAKIFRHGFTTREGGHGFGLHSSALAAQEMDGSLTVHCDGPGQGAIFTLELPMKTKIDVTGFTELHAGIKKS